MTESALTEQSRDSEKVKYGREIELHFIRHGENITYDYDAGITPESINESFKLGFNLVNQVGEGEFIKLLASPQKRSTETLENIQKGIKSSLSEQKRADVVLYTAGWRIRNDMRMFGFKDRNSEWFQNFKAAEDSIKYWLDHPDEVAESPEKVFERMEKFVRRIKKVSERLPSGPKIHYVIVTHSGPMRTLLRKVFGEKEQGVDFCESVNLRFSGDNQGIPVIEYKQETKDWSI